MKKLRPTAGAGVGVQVKQSLEDPTLGQRWGRASHPGPSCPELNSLSLPFPISRHSRQTQALPVATDGSTRGLLGEQGLLSHC